MSRPAAFALLLALACAGCESSRHQFADEYCRMYQDCCTAAEMPFDSSACIALQLVFAESYDGAAGDQCLDALRSAKEASQTDFCARKDFPAVCGKVLNAEDDANDQPPGGTCAHDSDCAASDEGDVLCFTSFAAADSVKSCLVLVSGATGIPCVGTSLNEGTADQSITFVSWEVDEAGTAPTKASLCRREDGVYCSADSHTCVPLKKRGEDCSESFSYCVAGDYCSHGSMECVAQEALGGGCYYDEDCQSPNYCAADHQCTAPLAKGSTCTVLVDTCEAGYDCLDGTCVGYSLALAGVCVSK